MYNPNNLAVYIHWPFCKSKCPYCGFYSQINSQINQDNLIAEYLDALQYYHNLTSERIVHSIFFGGGTPSLIKPQNIEKIIDFINSKWHIAENIEISLEANPNSRYTTMFTDLKNAGINRLSLGVQALNDIDLRFLGRSHSLAAARQCLQEIVKVFNNCSADLIYARPHQQINQWLQELTEICSYGLKHISLYQLTIEENTVFARRGIEPLSENESIEMYQQTQNFLNSHGYKQYEVSNFARKGYKSRHNLTYWEGGDYLGIGVSAHGRLKFNNNHIATEYPFKHTILTPQERAEELIIMGLRLNKGINKQNFEQICGLNLNNFINQQHVTELKKLKLLKETDSELRATSKGTLVLNEIIAQLCI